MNLRNLANWWQTQRPGSPNGSESPTAAATSGSPLARIPMEYQEMFRQTIRQEMTDNKSDHTDKDMLAYLRTRREVFQQGQYIDPNGKLGQLPLTRQELHAQGITRPQTGQSATEQAREKRTLMLKLGGLALIAVVFFLLISRGRAGQAETLTLTPEPTALADEVTPTPEILAVTGADDSLQTIGGLGGALTIGRPASLELYYRSSEEVVALPIDPAQTTPKGELRFNETVMLSDNPVAVWLAGTVVNYAIGIPDSLARNLQPGDRISLHTNTGATLPFIVSTTATHAHHEANTLLSQNRLGLTLFSLPAPTEDQVTVVWADYSAQLATATSTSRVGVGETFTLADMTMQVEGWRYDQVAEGSFQITVSTTTTLTTPLSNQAQWLLSLSGPADQTLAMTHSFTQTGRLHETTVFTVGEAFLGQPLTLELRILPGGGYQAVTLGELPQPQSLLQVGAVLTATWDVAQAVGVVQVTVTNTGLGSVILSPDFFQMREQSNGGEYRQIPVQVEPRLPLTLSPAETVQVRLTFVPMQSVVVLFMGLGEWEITGNPVTSGLAPPDQNVSRKYAGG
ncbi:MAG: hypothetical protein V9G20_13080 [Candidatus Promineifilaceae bacterium]